MSSGIEILIGKGLGRARFGDTRLEVQGALGPPDSMAPLSYLKDGTDIDLGWTWSRMSLEATFGHEEDFRLTGLAIEDPHAELNGARLIGLEWEHALTLASTLDLGELEREPMIEGVVEAAFFDRASVMLWMEEGSVAKIIWHPLWLDENTYAWPSKGD